MSESTEYDSTDQGTLRPNIAPLCTEGAHFIPINVPEVGFKITLPETICADDPIQLWSLYYTPEMIDHIVSCTNDYRGRPQDKSKRRARRNEWYPTSRGELYTYFAIRVYMTLHVENELSDYWSTSEATPIYPIATEMARDRFLELHMRVRLEGADTDTPYEKVPCTFSFAVLQANLYAD